MNDVIVSTKCAIPESCTYWFCHHHQKCLLHEHIERNKPKEQPISRPVFGFFNEKIKPKKKKKKFGNKVPNILNNNGCGFVPDRVYGVDKFIFCHYCGSLIPYKMVTRDHVIPRSKGGSNRKENIVPSCVTCNTEKGKMDYIDYLQYRYRSGRTMSQEAQKNFEQHLKE